MSKAGGRGACFVLTPLLSLHPTEFSVLNNLIIDCVAVLLNPVGGFCVDMAPCSCGQCHMHA